MALRRKSRGEVSNAASRRAGATNSASASSGSIPPQAGDFLYSQSVKRCFVVPTETKDTSVPSSFQYPVERQRDLQRRWGRLCPIVTGLKVSCCRLTPMIVPNPLQPVVSVLGRWSS
jgi:hypothetical protein